MTAGTGDLMARLGAVVASEFADVQDLGESLRIVMRLSLALLLGFALGYERESRGKDAGMRTHMLVALGSALFVLLPALMGMDNADLSRVVQGLVAGIGFLCAGTILKIDKQGEQAQVHGLTTAAGLWLTAAIGMACGLGREITAVIATVLALLVFAVVSSRPRVVGGAGDPPPSQGPTRPAQDAGRTGADGD